MTIETGSAAPDFAAKDETGDEWTLARLAGRKAVLFFYPKDDTPG